MSALIPFIFSQFSDNNGNPLSGGTIDAYLTGTTTRLDTYSDQAGTIHANPIVLLSSGKPALPIFLGPKTYDFVLKDSLGNTVETYTAVGDSTTGTFTATLTGCTATITGTVSWVLRGSVVTLSIPELIGTSNLNNATLTGLPAALRPDNNSNIIPIPTVKDAGNFYPGVIVIQNSNTMPLGFKLTIGADYTASFTNTGSKGIGGTGLGTGPNVVLVSYPLVHN